MSAVCKTSAIGLIGLLLFSNLAWSQEIASPRSLHPKARHWLGDNVAVYVGDLSNAQKAEFLRKFISTEKVALVHMQGKIRKFDPSFTFTYFPGHIERVTSEIVSGQFGAVIENRPGVHAMGHRYPREMKLEHITYLYVPKSCQILLSL